MTNSEWLDEYLLSKPGAIKEYKAEWEWWRYMVGGKMFAATMHPSEKYEPEYADKDLLVLNVNRFWQSCYVKSTRTSSLGSI